MIYGRVSPLLERKTFEKLAMMFEGSNTSGAERAYSKAGEKLTLLLWKPECSTLSSFSEIQ